MEVGFAKADDRNLPVIDASMIEDYYTSKIDVASAEVRNVKTKSSTRESYGDNAVGYVQLKRDGNLCTVKAKVTPEHRIRKSGYAVSVVVNELNGRVEEVKCHDCVASQGSCKHGTALLFWLHRRSEAPSVTSKECYWRPSTLSKVGRMNIMKIKDLSQKEIPPSDAPADHVIQKFLTENSNQNSEALIFNLNKENIFDNISIHNLSLLYKSKTKHVDADAFIKFCKETISPTVCSKLFEKTFEQSEAPEWHEARYCRITASKIYEVSKCKTPDGCIVETIFGAHKFKSSDVMKRGLMLEGEIIEIVSKIKSIEFRKSGFIISKEFPIFGASPDGISSEYCLEIKCPSKDKNINKYIKEDGSICPKVLSQLQLQMFLAGKKKGILCVAKPNFEESKEVIIKDVTIDVEMCEHLIDSSLNFWKLNVFPKLF